MNFFYNVLLTGEAWTRWCWSEMEAHGTHTIHVAKVKRMLLCWNEHVFKKRGKRGEKEKEHWYLLNVCIILLSTIIIILIITWLLHICLFLTKISSDQFSSHSLIMFSFFLTFQNWKCCIFFLNHIVFSFLFIITKTRHFIKCLFSFPFPNGLHLLSKFSVYLFVYCM